MRASAQLREVDWNPERAERVLDRIHERRRRFALSSVGLVSATLAVAVAVAIIWFAQGGPNRQAAVAIDDTSDPVAQEGIRLDDGTRAIELGSESRLRLIEEEQDRVVFTLDEGKGWFEVTPSETRKVEVRARDIRVEVLGTQFVVEIQNEVVHVWVQRGKVKVTTKDGSTIILSEGEYEHFEEPAKVPVDENDSKEKKEDRPKPVDKKSKDRRPPVRDRLPVEPAPTPPAPAPPAPAPAPEPSPIPAELVSDGAPGEAPAVKSVDKLWKEADAARLRGDNKAAISSLTELLDNYPKDARAALAAFSLGRVIIATKGGSPQTAARAFAKARKLDPKGPLVEDALLREVEAWDEAGDSRRVRSRAEKYMRLFPQGRYRKQLEQMIETP
jgi:TolA-binding protein